MTTSPRPERDTASETAPTGNGKTPEAAEGTGEAAPDSAVQNESKTNSQNTEKPKEHGGRDGLDPTRYGDWEKAGRCIDF